MVNGPHRRHATTLGRRHNRHRRGWGRGRAAIGLSPVGVAFGVVGVGTTHLRLASTIPATATCHLHPSHDGHGQVHAAVRWSGRSGTVAWAVSPARVTAALPRRQAAMTDDCRPGRQSSG